MGAFLNNCEQRLLSPNFLDDRAEGYACPQLYGLALAHLWRLEAAIRLQLGIDIDGMSDPGDSGPHMAGTPRPDLTVRTPALLMAPATKAKRLAK